MYSCEFFNEKLKIEYFFCFYINEEQKQNKLTKYLIIHLTIYSLGCWWMYLNNYRYNCAKILFRSGLGRSRGGKLLIPTVSCSTRWCMESEEFQVVTISDWHDGGINVKNLPAKQ